MVPASAPPAAPGQRLLEASVIPISPTFMKTCGEQESCKIKPTSPSRSRGASTGSTVSSSRDNNNERARAALDLSGFPTFGYPPALVVRNTFLEVERGRPPSLEPFITERQAHSLPCDSVSRRELNADREEVAVAATARTRALPPLQADGMLPTVDAEIAAVVVEAVPNTGYRAPAKCPSVGSAQHHLGRCKPCAFVHTKGCENGRNCVFCHLCNQHERHRRKKVIKARRQEHEGILPEFEARDVRTLKGIA